MRASFKVMFISEKMILNALIIKNILYLCMLILHYLEEINLLSDKITAYETNYIFLPVYGKV